MNKTALEAATLSKLGEIRHQLDINVSIAKRDHPEGGVLPHSQEILAGHIKDRLAELEELLGRSPAPAPASESEEDRALANFDKIADSFFASNDAMLSAPAEGVTDNAAEPFDTWSADALAVEIERLKKVSVTTNGIIAKMERRRALLLAAPPCGLERPSERTCPNMKEVGGGMDGERYHCAVCQKGYFLDYDEMR